MKNVLRFRVVSFVLVILVILAAVRKIFAPSLSAFTRSTVVSNQPSYVLAGIPQHINWNSINPEVFAEARREGKPILLVMGSSLSTAGQDYDDNLFASDQIARILATSFICVRESVIQRPDWAVSILPLSRVAEGNTPNFQIFLLDSGGQVVAKLDTRGMRGNPSADEFALRLTTALNVYDREQSDKASDSATPVNLQSTDVDQMEANPSAATPSMSFHAAQLNHLLENPYGGIPDGTEQRLIPLVWEDAFSTLGWKRVEQSIMPLLRSPTTDWLNGGFYFGSDSLNWHQPVYGKSALENADMALLLARLAVASGKKSFRNVALATANDVLTEFCGPVGIARTLRIGTEVPQTSRSTTTSFSPSALRRIFPSEDEREKAWDELGLRVETNPQMTPYLPQWPEEGPDANRLLATLAEHQGDAQYDSYVTLMIAGDVAARLIEAGRLLKDTDLTNRATSLYENLGVFLNGNDVLHDIVSPNPAPPSLMDYLGYSDAALQDFLSLGRVASLNRGYALLKRALDLYSTTRQGMYATGQNDPAHLDVIDSNEPEICDDYTESASAQLIRLSFIYSRIMANSPFPQDRQTAATCSDAALQTVARFATIAPNLEPWTCGYFSAARIFIKNRFVLAVGPLPSDMANQLRSKVPLGLVVPAVGPVWPSVQSRSPGYYEVSNGVVIGPLTARQAALALDPRLGEDTGPLP